MYSDFQGEACNFFFEEYEFFVRVATKVTLSYNPLLNLHKILEQLLLGRFYEITDRGYR